MLYSGIRAWRNPCFSQWSYYSIPYISAHLWLLHQTDMKERHATERRTRQFLDLTSGNLISLYYARSRSPLKPRQNKECALGMGGGEKQDNDGGKGRRKHRANVKTGQRARNSKHLFYSSLSSPDCMSFPLKTFFLSAKKKFLIRGETLLSIKLLSSDLRSRSFLDGHYSHLPQGVATTKPSIFCVRLPCLCTHFVIGGEKFLEIACAKSSNPFPNNWPTEFKY